MKKTLFIICILLIVFLASCSMAEPSTTTTIFSISTNVTDMYSHDISHQSNGSDEIDVTDLSGLLSDAQHVLDTEVKAIKLDDFTTPDDNTDLDATAGVHGLLPKLSNDSGEFLNGTGNWSEPAGGAGGGTGHIQLFGWNYNTIGQGSWAFAMDANSITNCVWQNSSSADGDNFTLQAYLTAGTYTLRIVHTKAQAYGIVDIDIGIDEVASFDWYNGATVKNQVSTETGIVIASSGLKVITIRVDGKNGSGNDYYIGMNSIAFWRTE